MWNPLKISPQWWFSSRSSILGVASSLEIGEVIMFSNFYALTDFFGKAKLWAHIRYIQSLAPFHPWILASDLNSIVNLEEKRGVEILEPSSILIRDNMSFMNLVDIKSSNGILT